jgi:hypothetical protein
VCISGNSPSTDYFDFGMPFFYGRNVFVGIAGQTVTGVTGVATFLIGAAIGGMPRRFCAGLRCVNMLAVERLMTSLAHRAPLGSP